MCLDLETIVLMMKYRKLNPIDTITDIGSASTKNKVMYSEKEILKNLQQTHIALFINLFNHLSLQRD